MMYQSCIKCAEEHEQLAEWLEQLKEYQTSELLGHLVKIPSEAYVIYRGHVLKCDVYEVTYCMHRKPLLYLKHENYENTGVLNLSLKAYLGLDAFLTKEEAEAKLKELRGGENVKTS